MPKFYVRSGELRSIVTAPMPEIAVIKAIERAAREARFVKIGLISQVTEHGFCDNKEDEQADDLFLNNRALLGQ